LSVLSCLMVVVFIASGFSPHGTIYDSALISVFSSFSARLAFKEVLYDTLIPPSILDHISLDYIISLAISLLSILSIPVLLIYDEDTNLYTHIKQRVIEEKQGKEKLIEILFYCFGILLYLYMVMNTIGGFSQDVVLFRIFQSFLVLLAYLVYLYRVRNNLD